MEFYSRTFVALGLCLQLFPAPACAQTPTYLACLITKDMFERMEH